MDAAGLALAAARGLLLGQREAAVAAEVAAAEAAALRRELDAARAAASSFYLAANEAKRETKRLRVSSADARLIVILN